MAKPTGPTGRQARWHELLSHFKVDVGYVPGSENEIADVMTRWAYPACETNDVSIHGNMENDKAMQEIIEWEKEQEDFWKMQI